MRSLNFLHAIFAICSFTIINVECGSDKQHSFITVNFISDTCDTVCCLQYIDTVGWASIQPTKIEWRGVHMAVCLYWGAECLSTVWPMTLLSQNPIISCLIKMQTGFTFLVLVHPDWKGSPYLITELRVPELIPVLGSQPAGDVSH